MARVTLDDFPLCAASVESTQACAWQCWQQPQQKQQWLLQQQRQRYVDSNDLSIVEK